MEIYEKRKIESSSRNKPEKNDVIDVNKLIIERLNSLNERELKLLVYINKAMINFMIKSDHIREKIIELT